MSFINLATVVNDAQINQVSGVEGGNLALQMNRPHFNGPATFGGRLLNLCTVVANAQINKVSGVEGGNLCLDINSPTFNGPATFGGKLILLV